jgi:hypothetical protein
MARVKMLLGLMALASIGGTQRAPAWERGPVCREPSVVDEITREIRAQAYYSQVDPALITEQPTVAPNVVRCQVCVHDFEIRIVQAGFVVRDLR